MIFARMDYTSGTTGNPKGVIQTYGKFIGGVRLDQSFKSRSSLKDDCWSINGSAVSYQRLFDFNEKHHLWNENCPT